MRWAWVIIQEVLKGLVLNAKQREKAFMEIRERNGEVSKQLVELVDEKWNQLPGPDPGLGP